MKRYPERPSLLDPYEFSYIASLRWQLVTSWISKLNFRYQSVFNFAEIPDLVEISFPIKFPYLFYKIKCANKIVKFCWWSHVISYYNFLNTANVYFIYVNKKNVMFYPVSLCYYYLVVLKFRNRNKKHLVANDFNLFCQFFKRVYSYWRIACKRP